MTGTALKAVEGRRIEKAAQLKWVAIGVMRVAPFAQQYRVDALVADFDLDQLGTPTVSYRDGYYWIIDGQHRIEALRGIGWGDQQIQCWTYEGLTEEQECEKFLKLNDTLAVGAHDRFRIGVNARREVPTVINGVVSAEGLHVSTAKSPGSIGAVGTLVRVYQRGGADTLGRTRRIIRDSFGDPGMQALVIDGIGHLCGRYGEQLDEQIAIKKLGGIHAGASGLLGKGAVIHQKYGQVRAHCVAAAAAEIINTGRGGKKLPSYWRES
jgi:hypothetical protein